MTMLLLAGCLNGSLPGADIGGDSGDGTGSGGSDDPVVATVSATISPDETSGSKQAQAGTLEWAEADTSYFYGTELEVKATPADGWTFAGFKTTGYQTQSLTVQATDWGALKAVVADMKLAVTDSVVRFPEYVIPVDLTNIDHDTDPPECTAISRESDGAYLYDDHELGLAKTCLTGKGITDYEVIDVTVHPDIVSAASGLNVDTRTKAINAMQTYFGDQEISAQFEQ